MLSFSKGALLTLCLAVVLSASALAQGDRVRNDPDRFLIVMQGYRIGSLSGSGLSSAFGVNIADMGSVNPAALSAFDRAAAGLAYQLETPIVEGYVAGIGYGPMNGARPQSAALVVPVGSWVLGASYNQRYAAEMDFGSIPRQTPQNPEVEPASAYDMRWASRVETISPHVAYKAVLASGGELALGARLGIGYGQFESHIEGDIDPALVGDYGLFSAWGAQVAFGASYHVAGAYGLAAYFESALRFEGERDLTFNGQSNPTGPEDIRTIAVPISDAIPARFGVSIAMEASPTLRIGADLARVFWKAAWDDSEQLRNNSEADLWARLDLTERSLISFGLLAQGRNRWDNGFEDVFDYSGEAVYLTLGGAVTFERFRLDAVLADSHLLSGDSQRQTLVKVGASVRL